MGTFFEIDLRLARRDLEAGRRYVAWVREEIDRLERIYSRHDPGSAISELNRAFAASDGSGSGVRVVPELEALLALSLGVGEESGGAFDVTVGPLVDVWNRAVEAGRWPSVEVLRAAKRRVGGEHVELAGDGRVAATVRDVRIDLDALSKGAVLDRLRTELEARLPDTPALLAFGQSSLVAIGAPEGDAGWRLDVRSREDALGGLGTLVVRDRAVSVSSSVGQRRDIAGTPVSHVIDPRTGSAVEGSVEAIVISDRGAAVADAWSTALLVLGAQPSAIGRLERAGLDGLVIELGGRSAATGGWERATRAQTP